MPDLTDALNAHFAEIYADLHALNANAAALKADLPVLIESVRAALPPIIDGANGSADKVVRAAENIKWRGDDVGKAIDKLNAMLTRLEAIPVSLNQQNELMGRAVSDMRYESDRMFGLSRKWAFFGAFAGSFTAIVAAVAINYYAAGGVFSSDRPLTPLCFIPAPGDLDAWQRRLVAETTPAPRRGRDDEEKPARHGWRPDWAAVRGLEGARRDDSWANADGNLFEKRDGGLYVWAKYGRPAFIDKGNSILVISHHESAIRASLELAAVKLNGIVKVSGNEEFKRLSWRIGTEMGLTMQGCKPDVEDWKAIGMMPPGGGGDNIQLQIDENIIIQSDNDDDYKGLSM